MLPRTVRSALLGLAMVSSVSLPAVAESAAELPSFSTTERRRTNLRAPKPRRDRLRSYAYLAGGLGVAGLSTFGVLGAMNQGDRRSVDERCPQGRCQSRSQSVLGNGETLQRVATLGLAVGLAGAGAAMTLWVLRPKSESSPRVSLSIKLGGVQLKGNL